MTYDLLVDAEELYDEARRELGVALRFGSPEDVIHEYIAERLAGASPARARYLAQQRNQPRRYRPRTRVGLRHEVFEKRKESVAPPTTVVDDAFLEKIADVHRAIHDLSLEQRVAVRMRFGIGRPAIGPSDIAREMGVSLSKVERLLRRAKSEIARRLS